MSERNDRRAPAGRMHVSVKGLMAVLVAFTTACSLSSAGSRTTPAPDGTPSPNAEYSDPAGRYSFATPEGWVVLDPEPGQEVTLGQTGLGTISLHSVARSQVWDPTADAKRLVLRIAGSVGTVRRPGPISVGGVRGFRAVTDPAGAGGHLDTAVVLRGDRAYYFVAQGPSVAPSQALDRLLASFRWT